MEVMYARRDFVEGLPPRNKVPAPPAAAVPVMRLVGAEPASADGKLDRLLRALRIRTPIASQRRAA